MSDEERPTYNGRYEVQRRIARGGMADVFLARDLLLARPVAVKVLFPEFASDPAFVARFRREAQAAANLTHANIVGVYDWGQEGGTYYIVMEFIDGRSLSEILRTQGTPPARTAAGIVADVAAALGHAHRNGVVHRDVKPGNIMITAGGNVKVADFGIARAMTSSPEDSLTQAGSVMGTATYFSPEQAQGHDVDQRSDLYSLGVVMYEMANGKPPFVADTPLAVAYKHVQEQPTPLREAHPEVPAPYEAIAMRLLAKSPDDRYPDADALRADLRRFLDGQRVPTGPGAGAAAAAGAGAAAVGSVAAGADGATAATRTVPPGAATTGTPDTAVAADATGPQPQYQQARGSRTGWYVLLLLVMLALLGGLLFLFAGTLGIGDDNGVEVPDVTGMPVTQAREELERAGFEVNPDPQYESSETVEADHVIRQDPPGGDDADPGTVITLVASRGPPEADQKPVPRVEGETVERARQILEDEGFTNVQEIERPDDEVPEGTVISQTPRGGTDAALDERITLIVSNGEPTTTTTEPPPSTTAPPSSSTVPETTTTTEGTTTTTEGTTTTTEGTTTTTTTTTVPGG